MGIVNRGMKVFVSYARSDLAFVDQMALALDRFGYTTLIDRHGISPGDDWRRSIGEMILSADAVVVVVSPDSLSSDVCQWEIDETSRRRKKMIPVISQSIAGLEPDARVKALNYIYFFDDPAMPGSGFGAGLTRLDDALSTDSEWSREHTHLEELAERWDNKDRSEELLSRGSELLSFRDWQKRQPASAPDLTLLQKTFLAASKDDEEVRVNAERRHLKEFERALSEREVALTSERAAQLQLRRRSLYGLAASAGLFIAALLGMYVAHDKSVLASQQTSRVFAAQAKDLNDKNDPDKALLFSLLGDPVGPRRFLRDVKNTQSSSQMIRAYLSSSLIRSYKGHEDGISAVDISADGSLAATASGDGTAKIWRLETGELVSTLYGHEGRVTDVQFAHDNQRVFTTSADGTVKIWASANGDILGTFSGHDNWVSNIATTDGDTMALTAAGKSAIFWEMKTGKTALLLEGHEGRVSIVLIDPVRGLLGTGDENGEIRFWSHKSGKLLRKVKAHESWVNGLEISPDGASLLTCSGDASMKIWDMKTLSKRVEMTGHAARINGCRFSPDGRRVVSGSGDGTIREWDAKSGELIKIYAGHDNWVYGVQYTNDGSKIFSGAWDKTARLWQAGPTMTGRVITEHGTQVNFLKYSPDGEHFLGGFDDGQSVLFDAATATKVNILAGRPSGHIVAGAFSGDGELIATGDQQGTFWVSTIDGNLISKIESGLGAVRSISFSPDSKEIAVAGETGKTNIYDVDTFSLINEINGHDGPVNIVSYSPDGRHLLTGSEDAKVIIWDRQGNYLRTLTGIDSRVHDAVYSSDSKLIVTAAGDATFKLWDAMAGQSISTMIGHSDWVYAVAFNPDNTMIASASEDGTVKLWDVASGQMIASLNAGTDRLQTVTFTLDGKHVLAGGGSGKIWQWPLDSILFADIRTQVEVACDKVLATGVSEFIQRDKEIYSIISTVSKKSCQ